MPASPLSSTARSVSASIRAISCHLPEKVLSNEDLTQFFPDWSPEKILSKLGIRERRVAADGETASDLAFEAARKLIASVSGAVDEIDFLIFCTQAPDFVLPTTACVLQSRLGLPKDIGAVDINLGCSGYVYGLSLASGLISCGAANNVLLLTADTYSKFINDHDRSVRTLFGDGATATLISSEGSGRMGPFIFGTDGSGANSLIVPSGGARLARTKETAALRTDPAGNTRSLDNLAMNGASVMSFTLREIPRLCSRMQEATGTTLDDYDFIVAHQANKFMLDALQARLGVSEDRLPRFYEMIGNTVSSSIPFLLADMMDRGVLVQEKRLLLLGFGVGLSWAGATIVW